MRPRENFTGRATLCGAGPQGQGVIHPLALNTPSATDALRSEPYFRLLVFGDEAEQSVLFIGDSGGEKDAVA